MRMACAGCWWTLYNTRVWLWSMSLGYWNKSESSWVSHRAPLRKDLVSQSGNAMQTSSLVGYVGFAVSHVSVMEQVSVLWSPYLIESGIVHVDMLWILVFLQVILKFYFADLEFTLTEFIITSSNGTFSWQHSNPQWAGVPWPSAPLHPYWLCSSSATASG